jgi:hypothetical protein
MALRKIIYVPLHYVLYAYIVSYKDKKKKGHAKNKRNVRRGMSFLS